MSARVSSLGPSDDESVVTWPMIHVYLCSSGQAHEVDSRLAKSLRDESFSLSVTLSRKKDF